MIVSSCNGSHYFPTEILFEILSWLKVSSLLRFKSVSKSWKEMIQERKFINLHLERSEWRVFRTPGVMDENFEIKTSCHGLLLEKSKISNSYRMRNPATKQILDFPDPQEEVMTMGISFIPSTSIYKLLCIYHNRGGGGAGHIDCKILTLGDDELSWRSLETSHIHELNPFQYKIFYHLLGKRVLFCLGLPKDGSHDSVIFWLDVETEVFAAIQISTPRCLVSNWNKVWCIAGGTSHMSLGIIIDEELHVWPFEGFGWKKLAEKPIIIPLTFLKEYPALKDGLKPLSTSNEKVCFCNDHGQIIDYHVKSKQVISIEESLLIPGKAVLSTGGKPSLVTLKGMKPEKKKQHMEEV